MITMLCIVPKLIFIAKIIKTCNLINLITQKIPKMIKMTESRFNPDSPMNYCMLKSRIVLKYYPFGL